MKKVWQMIAVAALCGLATSAFADVQNIRLSGDIRLRGYYLMDVGGDVVEDQIQGADSFISQRTRVCIEADLEDHVLVVVTLKAEGLWGADNETSNSSGAGQGQGGTSSDRVNDEWDLGITEAYLQLNELFYSPATLKVGRQYLHYGRGLIISSVEQEYNFDAARLVLDYYPLTIDLVYAALLENSPFGAPSVTHPNDIHMLFANARYEMTDSLIKAIEGYFGWGINSDPISTSRDINFSDASPLIVGLRADLNLTESLSAWIEGAYEFGPDGSAGTESLSAILANAGFKWTLKDVSMAPVINGNYTYASGGGEGGKNTFRPWFNYVDGNNGYLFQPLLSNIHIINLGATVKPWENTSLSVQGYYYLNADKTPGLPGKGLGDPNVDFGGLGFSPAGSSRELGWEIDTILGYDYSKDVRAQLIYAVFIPDNDFQVWAAYGAAVAHMVRGEVNVKF